MDFKEYIKFNDKDDNWYVVKPFFFHTPKRCLVDPYTNPIVMLFGKIYAGSDVFDVIQCISTKTKFTRFREEDDRYIIEYNPGDLFCSNNMASSISNQEMMNTLFTQGQILEDMEYQHVYDALMNASRNNVPIKVPDYFYEYTVAAMLRDTKDKSKMVRLTNPEHFLSLSVKQINMRADSFTALTTNDIETMIVTSLNEKKDAPTTPIKKTFLM